MLAPLGKRWYPYQEDGIRYLVNGGKLLCDDMGLGKTAQVIGAINLRPDWRRITIVCPAYLRQTWIRELGQWLLSPLTYGTPTSGAAHPDITVLSYNRLATPGHHIIHKEQDVIFFDEAQYLKNNKSRRYTRANTAKAKHKVFLTGTPMLSRPIDLWTILNMVDPEAFADRTAFGLRYCDGKEMARIRALRNCVDGLRRWSASTGRRVGQVMLRDDLYLYARQTGTPVPGHNAFWDFSGASNLEELGALLGRYMLRRTKEQVLPQLPAKIRRVVELAADTVTVGDWSDIVAALEQGVVPRFDQYSAARHELGVAKMHPAAEYIADLLETTAKVVVFVYHRDVGEFLAEKLQEYGVSLVLGGLTDEKRQDAVDQFQTGERRVFIGQINSAGTGLTLTAASHVVFVEFDWVPGVNVQAEDRAHRIGQKDSVLIDYLAVTKSLDTAVAEVILRKQEAIKTVVGG